MFVPRSAAERQVRSALAQAPATVLLGPRQVGKSTLARRIAAQSQNSVYLDLERRADRRKLEDPDSYFRQHTNRLMVIDEIHRAPGLFPELRGIIDERREAGARTAQFLLLGSASLDLMSQSAETLAGRVVYVELNPIPVADALPAGISAESLWLRGGFPESLVAADDTASLLWRQHFVQSYLERDVPMFAPRMPAETIGRLWTMLANAQGSLLNQARLAASLGVSSPMIGRYIDLLVDLKLVRRLQPWSSNPGKRLVKSPKVYVRDSGIVHALLEIETYDQLLGHPVAGPGWEGFVIENLIAAAGPRHRPFFYRTADGAEIDLIFEKAGKPVVAIEIKRSSAPKIEPGFLIACDDLGIQERIVVYTGAETYAAKGGSVVEPVARAVERVSELLG